MKKIIAVTALFIATVANAFTPQNPINVTIGYGPGGSGNEVSFRGVAPLIEKANPEIKFVISNKPGADEIIAVNGFMKLPADGSNLFVASYAIMTTSEVFYPNLLHHDVMDLTLITTIAKSPLAVIASIDSKTNTPIEMLARLKNSKEPINIGLGVAGHGLVYEHLIDKSHADKNIVKPVIYRSPADLAKDVAGGHVEFGVLPSGLAYSLYKAGKIKFIALTGEYKLSQLPNVPLWKDNGLPELNIYGHWILALPPNAPADIVKYYQNLFVPAINSKEAKDYFEQNLMISIPNEQSPESIRKFMTNFRNYWLPYAKKINLN